MYSYYVPLWTKSTANAAAECDPTEMQESSIREAARRTLVTVCDKFQLVRCSQSVVSYGWEKVCFKVWRKSWITNYALTWNFVSNCKKSAKVTHEMLNLVYGDAAVTLKMVYKWFEWFHNGCESVEDEERSGRPSTSKTQENVERLSEMIRSNRRLIIREISEDLNISYGSIQNILTTDLNMRRVSAKFLPRVLTVEQKEQQFLSNKHITVCPHPPYAPDLAPCDFWLFPKVKMTMKGKHFESIQDIEAATTAQLKTLTKEDFQNYIRKWQGRWDDNRVRSEGECFEGD